MRRVWPIKTLGLDLGSRAVKAVWIKQGLAGASLLRAESALIEAGEVDQALKTVLNKRRRHDLVLAGLSGHKAFYRWLNLPKLSGAKLRQAAGFELEAHLPVGVERLAVDLIRLSSSPNGGVQGLTFGYDKQRIALALADLNQARITPQVISLDTVGLLSAARAVGLENGVVVDVGASKTSVLCLAKGAPVGLGFLDAAGRAFDRHLAREEGRSLSEARAFKESLTDAVEVRERLATPLTSLSQGVARIIKAAYPDPLAKPESIALSGGQARLPGLGAVLAEVVGLEVRPLSPLGDLLPPEMVPAWGLALSDESFNLGRAEGLRLIPARQFKLLAGALALILILIGGNIYTSLHSRQETLNQLKAAEKKIVEENLPHVPRVVSPVTQMENELDRAKEELAALTRGRSEGLILETLLNLHRLTEGKNIQLSEVYFDGPRLSLVGRAPGFEVVEEYKTALSKAPGFKEVVIESSQLGGAGKGVKFRLGIKR